MDFRNSIPALSICLALFLAACSTKEAAKPVVYDGPLKQAQNIVVYHTEKEKLKTILQAKKLNEFQNGDREFPEGVYIEFYDLTGKMTSTLRANTAYFFKEENKWRGRGKVEVKNIEKQQQLNSEELFWKPDTKKIFTDKFVTITDKEDVIYGTGLTADQDLSNYSLKNTSGNVHVNE
ncbi:MAG: LPS export ABC transporter periplasmic protein LptC [Bacteroidetes bacterium]|nr:LPS export ABC transporter periplasmic protein LptC [Bacteroidota bacterium]MBI3483050.1 LPS export ABC transporter periplasmic protein LptC [Bacteroidota bacterium]